MKKKDETGLVVGSRSGGGADEVVSARRRLDGSSAVSLTVNVIGALLVLSKKMRALNKAEGFV